MFEVRQFRCPLCGMHAPLDRLDEDLFTLAEFIKTLEGKRRYTESEREAMKGHPPRRGKSPGLLEYEETDLTPEVIEKVRGRIRELLGNLQAEGKNENEGGSYGKERKVLPGTS